MGGGCGWRRGAEGWEGRGAASRCWDPPKLPQISPKPPNFLFLCPFGAHFGTPQRIWGWDFGVPLNFEVPSPPVTPLKPPKVPPQIPPRPQIPPSVTCRGRFWVPIGVGGGILGPPEDLGVGFSGPHKSGVGFWGLPGFGFALIPCAPQNLAEVPPNPP